MPHHEQRQYINTDEDTSGYLSDGRTSPTAWKSQSERSRPRMRLPNENRSKKTLQTPSVMETNRMYAMENGITNDELSSNNNSRRVAPFVVKNKYFKESNVDDICRTTPQQNGLKTDGNRNGQGRKMANSDSVDDNEHETDFSSIPKWVIYKIPIKYSVRFLSDVHALHIMNLISLQDTIIDFFRGQQRLFACIVSISKHKFS